MIHRFALPALVLGLAVTPAARAALVVHLDLNEAGGTSALNTGSSGATNNGTLTGGVFGAAGKLGAGVTMDGSGDYISAGASPITGTGARTVSVWVKTTSAGLTTVSSFGSNVNGGKWDIDIDGVAAAGNGTVEVGLGGGRSAGSGTVVNDGQWHLVTTVLPSGSTNLNQSRIYVDGVFQYTPTTSVAINTSSTSFYVGASVNSLGFQSFNGMLDDVAIWNSNLSDARVLALFGLGNIAGVDAGGADSLFNSYGGAHGSVTTGSLVWTYQASGLGGSDGSVINLGNGTYSLNLGGGAGFTAVPEPAAALLGALGCLALLRRRR